MRIYIKSQGCRPAKIDPKLCLMFGKLVLSFVFFPLTNASVPHISFNIPKHNHLIPLEHPLDMHVEI